MEYINSLISAMLNAGITIPALMIGYYLSRKGITKFIIPALVLGVIDHLLVKLLYIFELQQSTFAQIGSKLGQIDWLGVLTRGFVVDVAAFFVVSLALFLFLKLLRKIRM